MSKITMMNVLNKAFSYKKEKYSCNGYDIRIRIVFKLIQCIISVLSIIQVEFYLFFSCL